MNARYLLGIALATAAAVAACGGGPDSGSLDPGGDDPTPTPTPGTTKPGTPGSPGDPAVPGSLPTNSAAGKDFFAKNLQPVFDAKCAGCHQAGGTGNPTWMVKADTSKTYDMVYLQGFATATSRLVVKGVHAGGGGPELTAPEKSLFAQWLALEAKDALDLQVYSRVDVLLTTDDEPSVLEINTIPGMTQVSLLPEAAAAAGISYAELCARVISLSLAAR